MNETVIVQCEKELARVRQKLSHPDAERSGITTILDFLNFLRSKHVNPEPFLLRLEKELPKLSDPRLLIGMDPEPVWELYFKTLQIVEESPVLQGSSAFKSFLMQLRQHLIMLLAFVGETSSIFQLLSGQPSEKLTLHRPTDSVSVLQFNPADVLYKILSDGELGKSAKEEITRVTKFWESRLEHENTTVFIPVCNSSTDGLLRKISLDLVNTHKLPYDEFRTDVAVIGAEKSGSGFTESASDTCRRTLNKYFPHLAKTHFKGLVHFDMGHILHDGDSAQVGMALILFSGILQHADQQELYFPRTGLAITGALDDMGKISPVDSNCIEAKVRACFFSWIDTLVVPASQLDEFLEVRDELRRKYPNKSLDLVPVYSFEDTLYDRRVSIHKKFNTVNQALRLAWKKRTSALSIATIIILLGIIGAMWYGPIDKNPVRWEVEGNHVVLYNNAGLEINRILWDSDSSHNYIEYERQNLNQFLPLGLFDLFGDGQNHLVIGYLPGSLANLSNGVIRAINSINGRVIWENNIDVKLDYPFKPEAAKSFLLAFVHEVTVENEKRLLFIIRDRQYFSNFVVTADMQTGKFHDEIYVHQGAITASRIINSIEHDRQILAIGGIANYNNSGFAALLDLNNFNGHGPLNNDYSLNGFERANEIAYLVLPRTIIGKSVGDLQGRPFINDIVIFNENDFFIGVIDLIITPGINDRFLTEGKIAYHLYSDHNLNIKRISTTDSYDIASRTLLDSNVIDSIPDFDYFQNFINNEIKYYHNEEWITLPERLALMKATEATVN